MVQFPSATVGRAGENFPIYYKTPFPGRKRGSGTANEFRLPESHGPRYRARVGTWRLGYMIPIRLPWRPRARPSATLHEIPICSITSKLGIKYYSRSIGLSSEIFAAECAEKRVYQRETQSGN